MARFLRDAWLIRRATMVVVATLLPLGDGSTSAHEGHGGHHSGGGFIAPDMGFGKHNVPQHGGIGPGNGQSNVINYNPGVYVGYGVGGFYAYSPPLLVFNSDAFFGPTFPQFANGPGGGGGLMLPNPPRGFLPDPNPNVARARRPNPARAAELVEIGDRSFRGHNIKRAEERYQLAIKADPTAPGPHVHLAQVSIARGNYSAAADHLRDAVTVGGVGGWLLNAPDIQAIFGEPADFARQLARLETHLQANPNDRDAWFVLGAESYLSGRSRQALDVFRRLTDRRPDEALAAFLDASQPRQAEAN